MAIPTYDDANLILRLYESRRDATMREARAWFVKNARFESLEEWRKLCPPGSQENAYYRQVTTYWDMAASLVTSGVLHHELFFQSNREMLLVWVRIRKIVPELRKVNQDPTSSQNIELVAHEFIEWMNRQSPKMFEAFVERIK